MGALPPNPRTSPVGQKKKENEQNRNPAAKPEDGKRARRTRKTSVLQPLRDARNPFIFLKIG